MTAVIVATLVVFLLLGLFGHATIDRAEWRKQRPAPVTWKPHPNFNIRATVALVLVGLLVSGLVVLFINMAAAFPVNDLSALR